MGRKRFRYNPVPFDKFVMQPYGIKAGLLKEGDTVYKGKSLGFNQCYIYTKDNILLGMVFKDSLEKVTQ
jgi:hypothetical protein